MTFNIPIDNVKTPSHFKPDISYRDIQKTVDFGLAYGMTKHKLGDTIEVPTKVAAGIIEEFFGIVPDVRRFLDMLARAGVRNRYIKTPPPYGRIRWFDQGEDFQLIASIERASKNTPIQGANADLMKLSCIKAYERIREHNWWNPVEEIWDCKLIHMVHDELQTEIKEELASQWKEELNEIMITAGKVVAKTVPMFVDCTIGDVWEK